MKKSSLVSMILGTVGGVLFSLGMCMALLPEWNAFKPGVIFGTIGIIIGLIAIIVWRKMENKPPVKLSGKGVLLVFISIIGTITFGVGMCFVMVWGNIVAGTLIGLAGMVLLICLIPICKGIK